jgi:PKD repeat protein
MNGISATELRSTTSSPAFNAAHMYDKAGTYTVTLKVTDAAGKVGTATTKVTIAASTRRFVYVSSKGNDANNGRTTTPQSRPSPARPQLVSDNTEVLFERGGTYTTANTMALGYTNVVVGAYGTGAKPVVKWTGAQNYNTLFQTLNGTDVTIRGLAFDSAFTTLQEEGTTTASASAARTSPFATARSSTSATPSTTTDFPRACWSGQRLPEPHRPAHLLRVGAGDAITCTLATASRTATSRTCCAWPAAIAS